MIGFRNLSVGDVSRPLSHRMRALIRNLNRQRIAKTCVRFTTVLLEPSRNVEHYYHFIFDLALPLHLLIERAPLEAVFVLKHFGIYSERAEELFPHRVRIITNESLPSPAKRRTLRGMNPLFVAVQRSELASFARHVRSVLNIACDHSPNKILLIERLPPDTYFVNDAVRKGAGSSRRSIPNHDELAAALKEIVKEPYEFRNVQLENLAFSGQVELFANATVVIGQHGAGLSNCIWMRPGSTVIELSHDASRDNFRIISNLMGHDYHLHQTACPHAAIDVDQLIGKLSSIGTLSRG